jgi:hypothetical protein
MNLKYFGMYEIHVIFIQSRSLINRHCWIFLIGFLLRDFHTEFYESIGIPELIGNKTNVHVEFLLTRK